MQLDSETEAENICWRDLKSEWGAENCEKVNPGKMAEIMKIVDIYRVNGCMNGCSIRTSRFNHSCRSNAEATGDGIQVNKKPHVFQLFIRFLLLTNDINKLKLQRQ